MYLTPLLLRSMVTCLHYFYIVVKLIYLNLPVIFAVRPSTIGYETVKLIRNKKMKLNWLALLLVVK